MEERQQRFAAVAERLAVELQRGSQRWQDDARVEHEGIGFGWHAYFRWSEHGDPVPVGVGEVYVVAGGRKQPGWRCCRQRSMVESVGRYIAEQLARRERPGDDPFAEEH